MYDTFYAITNEIINNHIPLKNSQSRRAVKQTAKPWITPAIQTSINIKNKYTKNLSQLSMTFFLQNSNYIAIAYSFS